MFLPIRDDNPHTVTPFVNYGLIAACVAVFLWQFSMGEGGNAFVAVFGLTPGFLFGTVTPDPQLPAVPAVLTVFTSMFLHGGWMHLLGNMLYLWIFGDNIEASLGHRRYLMFYLLCGIGAALAQSIAAPTSDVPMVGASGAIAGVLGAYLVLHPRSNIKVFVFFFIIITTINVPAFIVLGIWFAGQLMSSAARRSQRAGCCVPGPCGRLRGWRGDGVFLPPAWRAGVRGGPQPRLCRGAAPAQTCAARLGA